MIFSLLLSLVAFGHVPSPESLLRSPSNGSIKHTSAVLEMTLLTQNPVAALNAPAVGDKAASERATVASRPIVNRLKLVYSRYDDAPAWKLVQLNHFDRPLEDGNIGDIVEIRRWQAPALNSFSENLDLVLFYGILNSLVLNDGEFLVRILRRQGHLIPLNSELVDEGKRNLLNAQKSYLRKVKANPDSANSLESPLRPGNPDARAEVRRTLNRAYLNTRGIMDLVRENGKLFWVYDREGLYLKFEHMSRRLLSLRFNSTSGTFHAELGDYTRFDSTHYLPGSFRITLSSGQVATVGFHRLRFFKDNPRQYVRRLQRYSSAARGSGKVSKNEKAPFVL